MISFVGGMWAAVVRDIGFSFAYFSFFLKRKVGGLKYWLEVVI